MVVSMLPIFRPIFPVHICHGTDKSVERIVWVAHGYEDLLYRFNHFQWGSLIKLFCLYGVYWYRKAQVTELVISMLVMKPIRYTCSKQWVHSYP